MSPCAAAAGAQCMRAGRCRHYCTTLTFSITMVVWAAVGGRASTFYVFLTPFAVVFRSFATVLLGVGPQTGDISNWIRRWAERPKDDLRNQF